MRIAIFGAGVAGSCCAIALSQLGHRVEMFERRRAAHSPGAGVVLWSNAMWIARQWGLDGEIAASGVRPRWMERMTAQGRSLGRLPITAIDAALEAPSVAILRSDLMAILHRRARAAGVEMSFEAELSAIREVGGRTTAILADGTEVKADLIIGADGRMQSVARRYVAPRHVVKYGGFANWVGVARLPASAEPLRSILDIWGVGKRFGIVPVGEGRAYWAAGIASDRASLEDSTAGADLASVFVGWPEPVAHVLNQSADVSLRTIPLYDLGPLPRWHRNNVLLVGDAAHAALPTSGQGACQAFEDAWHLGDALPPSCRDLEGALDAYFAVRATKTKRIVHAARDFASSLFTKSDGVVQERNDAAASADVLRQAQQMGLFWSGGLAA
jgi:FAD-dependent urate hydroxylase